MEAEEIWGDAPDVEWSCVVFKGWPVLVVQTDGESLSADMLSRDCETIEVRFVFDPEKLPELEAQTFVCFTDGEFMAPILTCEPDPMLDPLRAAVTEKLPWMLWLQLVIQGKPHTKMFTVGPDSKAHPITFPDGSELLGHWPCVIREE